MIYVAIEGRMGNQMFSYAFARYLQIKGDRRDAIVFDLSDFERQKEAGKVLDESWRNYMTEFVCGDWVIEGERKLGFVQRVLLSLHYRGGVILNAQWGWPLRIYEKKFAGFMSWAGIYKYTFGYFPYQKVARTKNLYLCGFFESPRYFAEIDNVLRKDFSLKTPLSGVKKRLYDMLRDINSVCINVRRGDFFENGQSENCGVCDADYYERAARLLQEKREDAVFYIFSDDEEWCRQNVHIEGDVKIIKCSDYGLSPQEQLWIMTACRDFIIANSTFSWWAQHLACREGKMVVAPDHWRNIDADLQTDIYEESWITIPAVEECVK
ncbi:MAG: alpha-1,2-fucosyltransferase [Lachnospiraceae bacterium]|nr:alpha-1,2-fucosyltransferase [Lachnospiraceae bacterium]